MPPVARSARIVGDGRAGGSISGALTARGWQVVSRLGRHDDVTRAADGVDLLVLATPDRVVHEVAASIAPDADTVVVHLAGSLGVDALAPHPRVGAIHPLVSLPTPEEGARRLLAGAWFAVAGGDDTDLDAVRSVVSDLGGRSFAVHDADRAAYHAAACIASNHLVALLAQVERISRPLDVPMDAFLGLARGTVDGVASLGTHDALTGPVARGDWPTVARHLEALPARERPAYAALAEAAWRLARTDDHLAPPAWLHEAVVAEPSESSDP